MVGGGWWVNTDLADCPDMGGLNFQQNKNQLKEEEKDLFYHITKCLLNDYLTAIHLFPKINFILSVNSKMKLEITNFYRKIFNCR